MPRNRAARRRAARARRPAGTSPPVARGPGGRGRAIARAIAAVAGLGLIVVALAVLSAPSHGASPGRATRGLALLAAVGGVLLWWGMTGRGV